MLGSTAAPPPFDHSVETLRHSVHSLSTLLSHSWGLLPTPVPEVGDTPGWWWLRCSSLVRVTCKGKRGVRCTMHLFSCDGVDWGGRVRCKAQRCTLTWQMESSYLTGEK